MAKSGNKYVEHFQHQSEKKRVLHQNEDSELSRGNMKRGKKTQLVEKPLIVFHCKLVELIEKDMLSTKMKIILLGTSLFTHFLYILLI